MVWDTLGARETWKSLDDEVGSFFAIRCIPPTTVAMILDHT